MLLLVYFLIHTVTAQNVNPTAELPIPTEAQTNEANAEIETQSVTVQTKISKCLTYLHVFLCFSLNKSLCFISSKRQFLVSSIFSNINSRLASSAIFIFKILMHYFVIIFIVVRRKRDSII